MLHQQFIIDVHGANAAELKAALVAAGLALDANIDSESSGHNFVVRRRVGYRRGSRLASSSGIWLKVLQWTIPGLALCMATAALLKEPGASQSNALEAPRLQAPSAGPAANVSTTPRRVYPLSVVPGGVGSSTDLAVAMRSDPLIAAHYEGFNVNAAVLKKVTPRSAYVSYRKDGKIFWTSHKVALKEGESVLTDGIHEIRARCGNRISNVAQLPVAANEPALTVLDDYVEYSENQQLQPVSNRLPGQAQGFTTPQGVLGENPAGPQALEDAYRARMMSDAMADVLAAQQLFRNGLPSYRTLTSAQAGTNSGLAVPATVVAIQPAGSTPVTSTPTAGTSDAPSTPATGIAQPTGEVPVAATPSTPGTPLAGTNDGATVSSPGITPQPTSATPTPGISFGGANGVVVAAPTITTLPANQVAGRGPRAGATDGLTTPATTAVKPAQLVQGEIPEPGTLALVGLSAVALIAVRRRKRKSSSSLDQGGHTEQ